jgi:UDP-N-acetylglucosamine 2-epimerase (non-hydrolysing)
MKKIAIILGTRPEAIKLIPVYLSLKQSRTIEPTLISTGQHKEMLQQIFLFFEIAPELELNVMTANQNLSQLTGKLFASLGQLFDEKNYDGIIVQGDTTTAMVTSLVGFYHKIKIIHVEAGLRTYNKFSPFPEEINRKIISTVGDIHFTPTEKASAILAREMINKDIYMVGNTVVDSVKIGLKKISNQKISYQKYFDSVYDQDRKAILITGHRRESFGEGFREICNAINSLASTYPELEFIYPVHLNPNVQKVVYENLGDKKNIHLIDPLPYDQLLYLMSKSHIILTDSGGIQEEAPSLNVPLVVLRDTTERPEGIDAGCAILGGTEQQGIERAFHRIYSDANLYKQMAMADNPYGNGTSSEKIREVLERIL